MSRKRRFNPTLAKVSFLTFIFFLVGGSVARSELKVEFDKANYTAGPGGTVDVKLLLRATGADVKYLNTGGADSLFSFGARINNDNLVNGAKVLSVNDIFIGALFDDVAAGNATRGVESDFARVTGISNDIAQGIQGGVGDPLTVELATFRYTLSNSASGVTNLSLADYNDVDNSVTVDGFTLDNPNVINFNAVATITAVPEPTSLALLGVAAAAGIGVRRWRKKSSNRLGRELSDR